MFSSLLPLYRLFSESRNINFPQQLRFEYVTRAVGRAGKVRAQEIPIGRKAIETRSLYSFRNGPPLVHGLQTRANAVVRHRWQLVQRVRHQSTQRRRGNCASGITCDD